MFQTNYFGLVHGCCVAVPHLKESGIALITLGSIASDLPSPSLGAYAASKHAIRPLSRRFGWSFTPMTSQ
jgi:NADP-dependent 3-hydroxy acid dehydrogenase YdfG